MDNTISTNNVLSEIRRLKLEAEKFDWLLGDDLSEEIINSLEEKENEVLEQIMWLS